MKIIFWLFILVLNGCALIPKAQRVDVPPKVNFSRYLMISTCYRDERVCRDPVAKNLNQANVSVKFINGVARNELSLVEEGLNFTGYITITAEETHYLIDLKLHSGNSDKRSTAHLSFDVQDLKHIPELVLFDKPIAFKKGLLRAQLVFGSELSSHK